MSENPNNEANMAEELDSRVGKIEGRLEGRRKEIDKINTTLFGNGRDGLLQTFGRVEQRVESIDGDTSEIKAYMRGLGEDIGEIKGMLKTHIGNKEIHSLGGLLTSIGLGKLLGLVAAVFAASTLYFIFISTLIPAELSAWEILSKWLGL